MRIRPLLLAVPAAAASLLLVPGTALAAGGGEAAAFGKTLPIPLVLPFVALLLAIALLPLFASHWWEHNRNKGIVAALCAAPVAVLLFAKRDAGGLVLLEHAGMEYVSFIVLLGSLFIISGGILVTGDIRATPRNNTTLLAIGGVLANFIGTTGASMLLIRPLLRINHERKRTFHSIIFFIFVVSNVGGCLTPLGDPPLFLGFLEGIPFFWTLVLWKEWVFMMALLLVVYFAIDTVQYRKEAPEDIAFDDTHVEPIRVLGNLNFLFLGGVIAAILVPTLLHWPSWVQTAGMVVMAALSLKATPKDLREKNGFTYGPIIEVAVLFAGIFVAMIPALQILKARGDELGILHPWQFFWATGSLSSFLDNAPTYLTFTSVAQGLYANNPGAFPGAEVLAMGPTPETRLPLPVELLIAISLGAVFMGANTYIGNGPNFMVKSIAESAGRKMPSFFGYMAWSVGILVPMFVLVTIVFL